MVRKRAHDRIGDIIETAGNIMLHKGYRRTQMADITGALGLSPGAVYRYVESKEALFDLVVRANSSDEFSTDELTLPVPTPAPGATLAYLRDTIAGTAAAPALQGALAAERPSDVAAEFAAIVRELYRPLARFQRGLRILERSALEWPELAELWWGRGRSALIVALAGYLNKRTEQGCMHRYPDTEAAARLITEVSAFYAMHRHYDPHPTEMSDETAEETAVAALVRAFVRS